MTTKIPITTPNKVQLQAQSAHAWTVTINEYNTITKVIRIFQSTRILRECLCLTVFVSDWLDGWFARTCFAIILSFCPSFLASVCLSVVDLSETYKSKALQGI